MPGKINFNPKTAPRRPTMPAANRKSFLDVLRCRAKSVSWDTQRASRESVGPACRPGNKTGMVLSNANTAAKYASHGKTEIPIVAIASYIGEEAELGDFLFFFPLFLWGD